MTKLQKIIAELITISHPLRDSENAGMIHVSEAIKILEKYLLKESEGL